MEVVIGSRGSQLALWQARHIAEQLGALGVETRIEIIKTTGDRLQSVSLVQAGGKGLFTKEIEDALLAGTIDVAVHSLKDLPTENPPGLTIAAIPQREDARDALVGQRLERLSAGARVGTSSNRRRAQLLMLRSDLQIEPVRGNVDTRLRKLREGQYEAIVLAAAGLRRLGWADQIVHTFSVGELCPAPGQGALAIQTRLGSAAERLCQPLHHDATAAAVDCERGVLSGLGGGCQLPIGAYASVEGHELLATAAVFRPDGSQKLQVDGRGPVSEPVQLGQRLAERLLAQGAEGLLMPAVSASRLRFHPVL